MGKTVAIIGSFQKYYDEITTIIKMFQRYGLRVTSPADSEIVGAIKQFVILGADDKRLTEADIEMITLKKILDSDFVYVYAPGGYVGKTTSYEIGACLSANKPLFYSERVDDLPIPILEQQILTPEAFVRYAIVNKPQGTKHYNMCTAAESAFQSIIKRPIDKDDIGYNQIVPQMAQRDNEPQTSSEVDGPEL